MRRSGGPINRHLSPTLRRDLLSQELAGSSSAFFMAEHDSIDPNLLHYQIQNTYRSPINADEVNRYGPTWQDQEPTWVLPILSEATGSIPVLQFDRAASDVR